MQNKELILNCNLLIKWQKYLFAVYAWIVPAVTAIVSIRHVSDLLLYLSSVWCEFFSCRNDTEMLPIAWWLLSESLLVLGLILLLRVMGNCVKQELRSASAHFLKDLWKGLSAKYRVPWHRMPLGFLGGWFCLLTEPRTSQTRHHHSTAYLEVVIVTAVETNQLRVLLTHSSVICYATCVWSGTWRSEAVHLIRTRKPTACLNISKRVLTLKHVFSFSTNQACSSH